MVEITKMNNGENGYPETPDSFELYQHDIAQLSGLSAEDERVLVDTVAVGRGAMHQLEENHRSYKLRQQIRNGEKALERLISSHLPLVIAVAKKNVSKLAPIEIEDLVQAGNLGLVVASQKFNPVKAISSRARFATYAYPWIWKYMIEEYQRTKRKIYIPDKRMREVSLKQKMESNLAGSLHRQPTYEELVTAIAIKKGIAHNDAQRLVWRADALGDLKFQSLDRKIYRDSETTLADLIRDPNNLERNINDMIDLSSLPRMIGRLLEELKPKERKILEIRFEIGTGVGWTIDEIARKWRFSKRRINKLEARALRKLRHPSRSRKLKDYLE